ncbi:hypothetical protein ACJ73_00052 [Blastomyces percursus]|uniref:Uncharacterized protein n=1 Tax=Blastomyces percursus TaxID=1658174 RepID=A0A1J9RLQ2_9EURO|nr:hypothetical protein ACJ73_00052 [Blastomyces percursus]
MSKATNLSDDKSPPASPHPPPNSPIHGAGESQALTGLKNEYTGFVPGVNHVDIMSPLLRNELRKVDPKLDKSRSPASTLTLAQLEWHTLSNNLAKLEAHTRNKGTLMAEGQAELDNLIKYLSEFKPVSMDDYMPDEPWDI